MDTVGAVWDLVREAILLGWLATAVFCAIAGAALALWGGMRGWLGAAIGMVGLYAGLLLVLVLVAVRFGERTRVRRADRREVAAPTGPPQPFAVAPGPAQPYAAVSPGPTFAAPVAPPWPAPSGPAVTGPTPVGSAPVGSAPVGPGGRSVRATGVRATLRTGWQRWTRTRPTRAEKVVAVLAVLLAAALVVATQVTWLKLSAVGYGVVGVGPFEIQLGLFVVLSAVAAVVCAVGLLRWRSAWWPVLLAWCGTWWLFLAVEVVRADGALDALNRLLRDQVLERSGYDARPELTLGVGWSVMIGLALAMLALSVALLVLQGRRTGQYRPLARLSTPAGPVGPTV